MWSWHEGGFVLQELNQSFISLPALVLFLARRLRAYAAKLDLEDPAAGSSAHDPLTLARMLPRLRRDLEREHVRCLHFDGSNWERREFLLPMRELHRDWEVPEHLRRVLYEYTGAEFPSDWGTLEAWDRFVELVLEAGGTPTRAMQAIAQWSADADDFYVDISVLTAPLGRKLDEPWTMDFTDLFCYTAFRDGFRPEDHGIASDFVGIQNIMGQRMRYNAVKKAQNYAPVRRFPPQGFNLPDISIAEDANHAGHGAAGVRLACRLPFSVSHAGSEWNGLADIRLNRVEYRRDNRFRPRDLVTGNRYARFAKGVADATYRRGLGFDEKWGNKVRDLDL
jgi:hypothetical protein